ncbi:aldo/keto reductase [Devosia sp. 1566]|uniref:aldo/keto reductase n=1 Tax=Devosia sp. 1566 TaxID=2499144 RepID=UPI000FDC48F6|nr:aldo/keto reductase [Devosia sp. 1566]
MRMRKFGSSGLFVSELSLGAMTFGGTEGIWGQVGKLGQEEADLLVKAALDVSINLFDTANIYANGRSEEILGQSFRNLGVAREDVVIATKVHGAMGKGPNRRGASRSHILSEVRASLRRLQVEHIDLYQLHGFDPNTPMEETLEALDTLVRAGDVRYIGLSNWAAWQIMKAIGITAQRHLAPITSLQAYYTLVGRELEREIVPMLTSEKIGLMVWSPLAGGYLSGKYSAGGHSTGGRQTELNFPPINRDRGEPLIEVLKAVGAKHGRQPAQIAIAWLLRQPVVSTVLIGAKRTGQLQENVAATEITLDDDDMTQLESVSRLPIEYPGWSLGG